MRVRYVCLFSYCLAIFENLLNNSAFAERTGVCRAYDWRNTADGSHCFLSRPNYRVHLRPFCSHYKNKSLILKKDLTILVNAKIYRLTKLNNLEILIMAYSQIVVLLSNVVTNIVIYEHAV